MDLNEIKKLLELMDVNKLVEFEYEEEGRRIRVRRAEDRPPATVSVMAPPMAAAMPMPVLPHPAAPAAAAGPAKRPDNFIEVKSPLVGSFYRSPKPDADPFVQVGDEVAPDKVLCIIEAMKVMNEIKAEVAGIVREIPAKNGQAVEFGELLFVIEKK